MIVNHKTLVTHIVSWIKYYLNKHGKQYLIIDLSNNISSMTLVVLCKNANIPIICVNTSFTNNKFTNLFKIDTINIPLDISVPNTNSEKLKSNLISPILASISHKNNGIIVGYLNKNQYSLIRSYGKYGNGNVDILPFADLYINEIFDLFDHLKADKHKGAPDFTYNKEKLLEAEMKRNKGISDIDLEWVDAQNRRTNIITDEEDPVRHKAWLRYTKKQRELIAKVHQLEKITRHKHNPNIPICKIRGKSWVVR